jgi:hypothetical protein
MFDGNCTQWNWCSTSIFPQQMLHRINIIFFIKPYTQSNINIYVQLSHLWHYVYQCNFKCTIIQHDLRRNGKQLSNLFILFFDVFFSFFFFFFCPNIFLFFQNGETREESLKREMTG